MYTRALWIKSIIYRSRVRHIHTSDEKRENKNIFLSIVQRVSGINNKYLHQCECRERYLYFIFDSYWTTRHDVGAFFETNRSTLAYWILLWKKNYGSIYNNQKRFLCRDSFRTWRVIRWKIFIVINLFILFDVCSKIEYFDTLSVRCTYCNFLEKFSFIGYKICDEWQG